MNRFFIVLLTLFGVYSINNTTIKKLKPSAITIYVSDCTQLLYPERYLMHGHIDLLVNVDDFKGNFNDEVGAYYTYLYPAGASFEFIDADNYKSYLAYAVGATAIIPGDSPSYPGCYFRFGSSMWSDIKTFKFVHFDDDGQVLFESNVYEMFDETPYRKPYANIFYDTNNQSYTIEISTYANQNQYTLSLVVSVFVALATLFIYGGRLMVWQLIKKDIILKKTIQIESFLMIGYFILPLISYQSMVHSNFRVESFKLTHFSISIIAYLLVNLLVIIRIIKPKRLKYASLLIFSITIPILYLVSVILKLLA